MAKTSSHLSGVCCQLELLHLSQLLSSAACTPAGKQPLVWVELEIPQDLTLLFTLPGIPIHPNLFSLLMIPGYSAHCSRSSPPRHAHTAICVHMPWGTHVRWQTPDSMVICIVLEVYWPSTSPQDNSKLPSASQRLRNRNWTFFVSDSLQPCWRTCDQIS